MAAKVDQQNQHDKQYYPMTNDLENSLAFNTEFDLIFKGYATTKWLYRTVTA